jgi:hypothetical protein
MDGRITLVEVGADALRGGFIAADQVTQGFYKGRREGGNLVPDRPDVNVAITSRRVELAGAPLLVQGPGPGGPVRPLSDLAGKRSIRPSSGRARPAGRPTSWKRPAS